MEKLQSKISLRVKDKSTGKVWEHHDVPVEDASWIQINPNLEVVVIDDEIENLEITEES